MKKVFVFLMMMASVFSATVFNLEFGQPIEKAKQTLIAKGSTLIISKDGISIFSECKLGEFEVRRVYLMEDEGVLIRVMIDLEQENDVKVYDTYEKIVDIYKAKLGNDYKQLDDYYEPYKKHDGYLRQALIKSRAFIYTYWKSQGVIIKIQEAEYPNVFVGLIFEDHILFAKYIQKKKAKESADY